MSQMSKCINLANTIYEMKHSEREQISLFLTMADFFQKKREKVSVLYKTQ